MKDHAWIDFEWKGKRYRYTGKWPDAIAGAIGDAHCRLSAGGDTTRLSLLREAGATILEVHSIRPDGSIHSEDLPDFKFY